MAAKEAEEDSYSQGFEDDQLNLSFDSDSSHCKSTSEIFDIACRDRCVNTENCRVRDTPKFRAFGSKVRAAQTASKCFQSSQTARDVVYKEWLERKSIISRKTQRQLHEDKMKKDAALRVQANIRAERVKTTLQQWNDQKTADLVKKHRILRQQMKEKECENESQRERKKCESETVYAQWKKKKTEQLLTEHQQRKIEVDKCKKDKEIEELERNEISRKVTEIWNKRKDELLQQKAKTAAQEKRVIHTLEVAKKRERILESEKASKEWNKRKSLQKANKSSDGITQQPAWCPARSLSTTRKQFTMNTTTKDHVTMKEERCTSYSLDSFSSECISESEDGEQGHNNNTTGTLKTVQVCCKTLEYWCNCSH